MTLPYPMKAIIRNILLLTIVCAQAKAQDNKGKTGNLGNEDVNVVKEYTPILNDAFKININPDADTSTLRAIKVPDYLIEARPMNSNYNTSPIKPVRIKDDAIKKLYRGFVKAGYGLESMPLLDVSFNSLRSKSYDAGLRFKHLSASGKINDYGFPGNSNNNLNAFGTRYFEKFSMTGEVTYNRDAVHYYGFQSPPELFSKSETLRSMNTLEGKIGLTSSRTEKEAWNYHVLAGFYNFSDNLDASENNTTLNLGISKHLNNSRFSIQTLGDFGKISQTGFDYTRNIVRFNPRLDLEGKGYTVSLGGNLAVESNNGNNDAHLYPFVHGEYAIIDNVFRVHAGIKGDLQRNDLRTLSGENPFLGENIALNNTNQRLAIEAGTSIKLEHHLMLHGTILWSRLKNQDFFKNTFSNPTTFNIVYDDATLLQLKGALEYKQAEKYTLAFSVNYNNYSPDNLKEPLYIPAIRIGFNGSYTIAEKIYLHADFFYNSSLNGVEYQQSASGLTEKIVTLKGYMDANLGLDYRYSKVLSAFVSLNNIGFARYFRWYEYPSYRFLGMAGITYAF